MVKRDADLVEPSEPSEEESRADLREHYGILLVRAPNPGPLTLTGTNSWVVGRDPAWVVDPGPLLDEHLEALYEAIDERGGLGGAVLTHDHQDHSEAARTDRLALRRAARGGARATSTSRSRKAPGSARSPRSPRRATPPITTR